MIFPLFLFETGLWSPLRLPRGTTLIMPDTWRLIAFRFTVKGTLNACCAFTIWQRSSGGAMSVPEPEKPGRETRWWVQACVFSSINCPRLRLRNIPGCLTSLMAHISPAFGQPQNIYHNTFQPTAWMWCSWWGILTFADTLLLPTN